MQRYSGFLFMALAAVFWAFLGPVARVSMAQGISPLEVAFWRAFFGAMFFWLHALPTGLYKVPFRIACIFSVFGIFGVGLLFGLYLTAVQEAGVALTTVLLYTAPVWVALFSRFLFREKITFQKSIALVLALLGAALATVSGGGLPQGASTFGITAALATGLLYASHYVFGGYYLTRYSPIALYCWCMPVGALCLLPWVTFAPKTWASWIPLLAIGAVSTYAAFWSYCEGLKRLPPTIAAVIANLEPILAALLAWWWWGEFFPLSGWIGAFLVVSAVLLVVLSKSKQPEP